MTDPAFDIFKKSLDNRAKFTSSRYVIELDEFKVWSKASTYATLLKDNDAKAVEDQIMSYMQSLKERKLSFSKMNIAISALDRFYLANRIVINKRYIRLFLPKREKTDSGSRGYEKQEITKLIAKANMPNKLFVVLLMATAGMRIGALEGLRIKDLILIEPANLFAIKVYANSQEEYFTYTTPQVSELIKEHIKGKKPNDFLLQNSHDKSEPVKLKGLINIVGRLLFETGLRKAGNNDKNIRKPVQATHGLRKFFRTQLTISGVHQENAEYLLGHIGRLIKTYSKPSPHELYGIIEYDKAIPNLTFEKLPRIK